MTASDIAISTLIALTVNLATPLIQHWIISFVTGIKANVGSASIKILEKRKSQLEESLQWHKEKSDPKQLLEWLLPYVFYQIIFLWFLVLLPYFMTIASDFWSIPEAVSKGGVYGLVGLGTRYFFSFMIVATLAQKSLSFNETEKTIVKQIMEINKKLGYEND